MDCSPPGSSVHGILQARILEWVAISFSEDLPDPRIEPTPLVSPAGVFFITSVMWEAQSSTIHHLKNSIGVISDADTDIFQK